MENILTIPAARLVKLIDLELYPYKRFAGSGQCASRLFKQLAKDRIGAFFTSAAFWRLEKKEAFLKGRLADRSLQLSGGIAMALGYKHNTEAFLDLFLFLLPYRDLPFKELLALAIGCCGFFEKEGKSKWDCSIYYQQLLVLWRGWRDRLTHQACLRLDHIRPLNHPIRRLAYLVKLMQDSKMDSLWLDMLNLWNGNAGRLSSSSACKLFFDQLIDLIPTYADDYWNKHYTFEAVPKKQMLPLIGRELKKEILINTYLPLLYAFIRETGDLAHLAPFQLFYHSLTASPTSKGRYLIHRFFGDSAKGKLLRQAPLLHGAYQLHKDFCVDYEASCEGCPFVERFLSRL